MTDRITVSEVMAGLIHHYYGASLMGAPKHLKTMRDIARRFLFTGLANVPGARLQTPNEAIRFAEGRKDGENALLTASKGVLQELLL